MDMKRNCFCLIVTKIR